MKKSLIAGAVAALLTLPVLAGGLLVAYIDLRYGGSRGFIGGGAAPATLAEDAAVARAPRHTQAALSSSLML